MLDLTSLSVPLLQWWDEHKVDLPWRRGRDPYAIWIAEVMLQQTQISTVIPYYERWLAQFPTVEHLAAASLSEVLKQWEGLGYYSRARNLHAAAQTIVATYSGQLPQTAAELQKLKGIGPYTAGAIASIAFQQPVPIVDGNITRVLTRLADIPDDISQSQTQKGIWHLAGTLVPLVRPGDYNQALMELGQKICLPAMPRCAVCPAAALCQARANGTQLERPVRPRRPGLPHYHVAAGVIWRDDGRFLIAQRPLNGLLGGLWEFPGGKQEPGETLPQTLKREISEELGIVIKVAQPITMIKHAYTHFRITLHTFHAHYQSGQIQHLGVADHAWVTFADLARYPFAVTDQKIIAALVEQSRPKPL
ncbi:MAG: A/G-specific adenine glycosylase [Anaerolineae bacterium]|nr:A/G-specific adenine glycosylase [Anaerolineae bacterium]